MKIGILTQPLSINYGGLLQNYALQQTLSRRGHDVETIDHGLKRISPLHKFLSDLKRKLLSYLGKTNIESFPYIPTDKDMAIIRQEIDIFVKKYIKKTSVIHSNREFKKVARQNKYDAYVVGSDQCWRPKYNSWNLKEMFLSFVPNKMNILRMAYAASFGTDQWELNAKQTYTCSKLAKKFDIITVREDSAVKMCKDYLGVDASHVLDPTMLLVKDDYVSLVYNEKEQSSVGDLFYYILDPSEEVKELIEVAASKTGLKPFSLLPKYQAENLTKEDVDNRIRDCVYPSVTSWLRAFMDAKLIIVDSFHGVVFSLIFNKPFWVINNKKRGSARFDSLLNLFNLKDRFVTPDMLNDIDWSHHISWDEINKKMECEREKSIRLIERFINYAQN